MAEALLAVDVLIRQIYAAGEGHLAVDDQDFPVIPVVIVGGEEGLDGGKGLAADAQLFQPPGIVPRQGGDLQHPVVQHPHVHALRRLVRQNFQNTSPHIPLINDEVLQKNELLRLLQLLQQRRKLVLSLWEELRLRVGIQGKRAAAVEIAAQIVGAGGFDLRVPQHLRVLMQQIPALIDPLLHPPLQSAVTHILLREPEENTGGNGDHRQQEHPRQLPRGVHVAVKKMEKHQHGEHALHRRKPLEIVVEPAPHHPQKHQLQNQQQRHETKPAEHHPQDALATLFHQPQHILLLPLFLVQMLHPFAVGNNLLIIYGIIYRLPCQEKGRQTPRRLGLRGVRLLFVLFLLLLLQPPAYLLHQFQTQHGADAQQSHRQSDLMPHGPTSYVL